MRQLIKRNTLCLLVSNIHKKYCDDFNLDKQIFDLIFFFKNAYCPICPTHYHRSYNNELLIKFIFYVCNSISIFNCQGQLLDYRNEQMTNKSRMSYN